MPHRVSVLKCVVGTQCCITQAMAGCRVPSWEPQRSSPNCDLSRPSSIRMSWNVPHYYRNIDFAVSAVNGAPRVRGCPGGKITSIGDLQVRYFRHGGVPVESWDSFCLLCNILCDFALLGGVKNNYDAKTDDEKVKLFELKYIFQICPSKYFQERKSENASKLGPVANSCVF